MIATLLLVLSVVVNIVTIYIIRRALKTNTALSEGISLLENQNTEALEANRQLYAWFEELKERLIHSYQRIKAIDAKGSFEADDEVGFFFKELKSLIEYLHELGMMDAVEKQEALTTETKKITTEELQKVLAQRDASATKETE